MPEAVEKRIINGRDYTVLRDLGGGLFHESALIEGTGGREVLRRYPVALADELERQWQRWREAGLGMGAADLVGFTEVGMLEGRPFVLRRWIDTEPFDAHVRRAKFNWRAPGEALEVGQAICRPIAALHRLGLLHGHVTNNNVFFGEGGAPVLTDPWLARPTAMVLHHARKGAVRPGSLAPEQQHLRTKVDSRTDVWALGLLLSRLYTRKPDLVVNHRILMELYGAKLPIGLLKVLWQAIQEDATNRFPDAGTLATALAEVTLAEHQRTVHVRPAPSAKGVGDGMNPALKKAAIVVVVVGALAGGAWLLREQTIEPAKPQQDSASVVSPAPTPAPAAFDPRLLRPRFTFETNLGKFEIEAYGDAAPIAVQNFAKHVEAGSFDGVAFDRVVPNFVIQAGQFTMTGERKSSSLPPIRNEWLSGGEAVAGTVGMSRLGNDPDSITTTFFINMADNRRVFGTRKDATGEIIFGKVVAGADVVQAIAQSKTVNKFGGAWPDPPVYITSAYWSRGFDATQVLDALEAARPRTATLPNGVVIEDVVVGRGREFDPACMIAVHCVGKSENGAVFMSSREIGEPMTLEPGSYSRGLGEGLAGMRIGGRRFITIPPELGFASAEIANIPANATLIFDIQLIAQSDPRPRGSGASSTSPPDARTGANATGPSPFAQPPEPWTIEFPGADEMKLVGILPFGGMLGHPSERNNPPHEVGVTRSFSIAVTTVTVAQFSAFVRATNYVTTAETAGSDTDKQVWALRESKIAPQPGLSWRNPGFPQQQNHPVTCVSWDDAQAFCVWLSERTGKQVRLPTESEWEYSARAGTESTYWWGDDPAGASGRANVADQAFRAEFPGWMNIGAWNDSFGRTAPVGSFAPNVLGLHDMGGNVWEWCQDRYSDTFPPAKIFNWEGPAEGNVRSFRGSAYNEYPPRGLSYRYGNAQTIGANMRGFRIVVVGMWRTLDDAPNAIPATQVSRSHVGSFLAIEGRIAKYTPPSGPQAPHVYTLVDRSPDPVELIYWDYDAGPSVRAKYGQPAVGDHVAAAGYLVDYKGRLQVRVERVEQIQIGSDR